MNHVTVKNPQLIDTQSSLTDLPFSMIGALVPQPLSEAEMARVSGGTFTGTLPIEVTCDSNGKCVSQGDCD